MGFTDGNKGTNAWSYAMWEAASGAYTGENAKNGGFTDWAECTDGNANAQFHYKCDYAGCNMNLAFAGSDDGPDWMMNAKFWKKQGKNGAYHKGFWEYQNKLVKKCVKDYRDTLEAWGIKLDYIVGHSLGGAAATVYAQEHGNALKGVVTFGAPKTDWWSNKNNVKGWRFIHDDDPVGSNLCCLGCPLFSHKHALTKAYRYYDKLVCGTEKTRKKSRQKKKSCQKSWWKFWCWFEWIVVSVWEWITTCTWHKRIKSTYSNFAHGYWSLPLAIAGAATKHGAYGEYPSQWLTSPMQANTRPSGCPQLSNAAISALTSALEPRAIVLFADNRLVRTIASSATLHVCWCRLSRGDVGGQRMSEVRGVDRAMSRTWHA